MDLSPFWEMLTKRLAKCERAIILMICIVHYDLRAEACLGEFLKEIKAERIKDVRFQDMTNVIVIHARDERKRKLIA